MTVAWDAVEAACEAWAVRVLNGTTTPLAVPVVWKDRAHADTYGTYVELSIDGERSRGTDDISYEDDDGTLTPRITGAREFTLECQVRSRDQASTKTARNYLERLRASLGHPLYLGLLEVGGVAFHRSEVVRTIPYVNEGRRESMALLEIHCGVSSEFYDAGASIDFADSADVAVSVNGGTAVLVDLES